MRRAPRSGGRAWAYAAVLLAAVGAAGQAEAGTGPSEFDSATTAAFTNNDVSVGFSFTC